MFKQLDDPEIRDRLAKHSMYSTTLERNLDTLRAKFHEGGAAVRDTIIAQLETHKASADNMYGLLKRLAELKNDNNIRSEEEEDQSEEAPAGDRNSELERLRRRRQLLMTGREMSLKQWVSRVESLDTESKEAVKALRAMAVSLGIRLSLTLVPVMYMTNMSKGVIRDKFRDFELVQNRLNQKRYSGEGVVYNGIIAVLQKADQELNKRRDQNKKSTSNWYESEDKIDQLLRQFGLLIANMETVVSFPILPEEPVLMRSSLPLLEKTLIKMGTELNELEIKVNEMKDKFTTSLKTGDSAMDAFFQLFCNATSDYGLE